MLIDGVYTIGPLRIAFWDGDTSKAWGNSPFGIMVVYKGKDVFKMLDGVVYVRPKAKTYYLLSNCPKCNNSQLYTLTSIVVVDRCRAHKCNRLFWPIMSARH